MKQALARIVSYCFASFALVDLIIRNKPDSVIARMADSETDSEDDSNEDSELRTTDGSVMGVALETSTGSGSTPVLESMKRSDDAEATVGDL
jgi:hypothetical protein